MGHVLLLLEVRDKVVKLRVRHVRQLSVEVRPKEMADIVVLAADIQRRRFER